MIRGEGRAFSEAFLQQTATAHSSKTAICNPVGKKKEKRKRINKAEGTIFKSIISLLLDKFLTQVEHKKSCRDDMDTRISKEYTLFTDLYKNSLGRQRSTRIT